MEPEQQEEHVGDEPEGDKSEETKAQAAEEETKTSPSESDKTDVTMTQRSSSPAFDGGYAGTQSGSALPTLASREPPPLFDAEDEDDR